MYWVAGSPAATLIANRFAPALLDRYLAKTGYHSQQTHQPPSQYRPDNLWQPAEHLPVSACLAALELPVVVIAFLRRHRLCPRSRHSRRCRARVPVGSRWSSVPCDS